MNALTARALEGVRTLEAYQPGKPIEELERELGIRNILKLASNENPLGPSAQVQPALTAALAQLALYPDGSGFRLRSALARHHGVGTDGIVLGNGSNDILELVARTFLCPGRKAVFSDYAFAVYPIASRAVGATLGVVPALPPDHPAQPYGHDLAAMARAIDADTGVVFIANPNNPTGTWLDAVALEQFIAAIPPTVAVVLDEAYYEYMDERLRPDSVAWLQRFPNLIITRTFSKVHGLAALRVGYALTNPAVADLLNRVRQPFNVNALGLAAAEVALDDAVHVAHSVETNRAGLAQLKGGVAALGLRCLPSQGNFLSVDMGRPALPLYQALLREGVIVRPLASYRMPGFLRITAGTAPENARCLAALKTVLNAAR